MEVEKGDLREKISEELKELLTNNLQEFSHF